MNIAEHLRHRLALGRTGLGLGTIATQAASAVAITGGTINGTTLGLTTRAQANVSLLLVNTGTDNLTDIGQFNGSISATAAAFSSTLSVTGVASFRDTVRYNNATNNDFGYITNGGGSGASTFRFGLNAAGVIALVLAAGSATFIGDVVAPTFNGNTITTGTGVLTLGAGKTATISNTLTFTGTDASSVAFGAGGTIGALGYIGAPTSGAIPYGSSSSAVAWSAAFGATQVVLGGGAGAAPNTSASLVFSGGKLTIDGGGNSLGGIVLDGTNIPGITLKSGGTIRGYSPFVVTSAGSGFTDSQVGDFAFRSEGYNLLLGRGGGPSTLRIVGPSVGIGVSPTAYFHIAGGTSVAGTAPFKMTSGALLSATEAGTLQYLSAKFYITGTDGLSVAGRSMFGTATDDGVSALQVTGATALTGALSVTAASPMASIFRTSSSNTGALGFGDSPSTYRAVIGISRADGTGFLTGGSANSLALLTDSTFDFGGLASGAKWATLSSTGLAITGTVDISGITTLGAAIRLKNSTVGGLPAGTQGDKRFVTDALAPTYLTTVAGGGAIVTEVFYNGTNWVCT